MLKLQSFGHLMQRVDLLERTLMLEKTEGQRRRRRQKIRWLDGLTNSIRHEVCTNTDTVKDREAWCAAVHAVAESWTGLSDGTTDCQYLVIKLDFWLAGLHPCFLFWITPGGIQLSNSKQPHQPTQVIKEGQQSYKFNHVNEFADLVKPGVYHCSSWQLGYNLLEDPETESLS